MNEKQNDGASFLKQLDGTILRAQEGEVEEWNFHQGLIASTYFRLFINDCEPGFLVSPQGNIQTWSQKKFEPLLF